MSNEVVCDTETGIHYSVIARRIGGVDLALARDNGVLARWVSDALFARIFTPVDPVRASASAGSPEPVAFCPKCGSLDGYLGTSNAYFCCRACSEGRPVYWTPDHQHPNDWAVAILASPHGRKSEVLQMLAFERSKRADAEAELERLQSASSAPPEQELDPETAFAAGFNATFDVNRWRFDNAPTDHRAAYAQWLAERLRAALASRPQSLNETKNDV